MITGCEIYGKIDVGDVDARENCANLMTPLDSGTPLIRSSFYVHLGLQIGLNFVPEPIIEPLRRVEIPTGHEIEFFLWSEMYVNAGSLTSTYRVVRKYNFKS